MEIYQPVASEVSSHGGSPDHEQEVQSQSQQQQPRSYECNFCKKGFSNAQALGGHMNIHRKDKAKANLKQPSSKQQPHHHQRLNMMDNCTKPLDITSKRPGIYSSDHLLESSYPSPRDGTHVSELKQLPLFVEKATNYSNNPLIHHASANWHDDLQSNHGSFGADLDLELRLGHVPPKSSVAMGTRKFF